MAPRRIPYPVPHSKSSMPSSPLLLFMLCTLPPLAACAERSAPPPAPQEGVEEEDWFRRDPWRPKPPEEVDEEPIVKIELPEGVDGSNPLRPPSSVPGSQVTGDSAILAWKPGDSSDTITLNNGMSGYTLSDTIVQASARTAFIAYQGGGPYRGTRLTNCILRVDPNTVPEGRSFWAMRGYDMQDTVLDRVEITGFGKRTGRHDEGHAVYFNVLGSLTLTDCNVHHNGGQGLQLVNRPYESTAGAGPAQGTITVQRTWFHENAFNPDRGGSQVSIFGTGQDVLIEEVEITAGHDQTIYDNGRTGGGLLIEAEYARDDKHNAWWRPLGAPKDFKPPFTQGTVRLESVLVDHKNPNRPLVQIKGCKELLVSGCVFNGGRVNLDDPSKPGRNNGRIVWEGNAGDAIIHLAGERIGTASEDFVAVDGKVQ